jgi:GNAT superfamily N-acetyltransferase
MSEQLRATVTYLEMTDRPSGHFPPRPLLKTAILKAEMPPVHFYRYLYGEVGRDYFWLERQGWGDETLAEMLADEKLALYVLYIAGVPAGFAELDFRESGIGLIAHFGLMPDFVGRRIGPWFLHQTIELAWAQPIGRLRVSTSTLDHRKALPTYQRAGFVAYARGERLLNVPEGSSPARP